MKLFKRIPFMDELLKQSRVLIKPYFVGRKVKIELNNAYILELSYSEALEANKQLTEAIRKLDEKIQLIKSAQLQQTPTMKKLTHMINTIVYTTNQRTAKAFAKLCGVKKIANEDNQIGFGFNERAKANNCVIGFQKGSGFDDGQYKGVKFNVITEKKVLELAESLQKALYGHMNTKKA